MKIDKSQSNFEEKVLSALAQLQGDVSGVKTDISGLKSDVSDLKTGVSNLRDDVNNLKTDVHSLKTDVSSLKDDVRRLEVLHEETDSKIDHILEVVVPNAKEITQFRNHESEQDETILFHDRRIGFLEKKIA